jgi:transposase
MNEISTIGLDIHKSKFQLHGIDEKGDCKLVRRLDRHQVLAFFKKHEPCTVAIEACGAAHYWAREIEALGHTVKLAPAAFLKRFRDGSSKTDARDARALAFAGRCGGLRAVPIKSAARQAELLTVKARSLAVRQHTQAGNAVRAHLAEFGLIARCGDKGLEGLIAQVEAGEAKLPEAAIAPLAVLIKLWRTLGEEIALLTARLVKQTKADDTAKRLMQVPGVGPVIASVFQLKLGDPARFSCGRNCAAWLGLTPKEHSSGKKRRLGAISKAGDEDLRSLLVLGAASLVRLAKRSPQNADPWLASIAKRKPFKVAATALAARIARILWAMLRHGTAYKAKPAKAAETA